MSLSLTYNNLNKHALFFLLILSSILSMFILQEFIVSEDVYFDHFSESLPLDRVTEILHFQEKWWWVNYLTVPVIYLIKFSFLALWLLTGTVFMGFNTSYKKLFNATILAEFVAFIPIFTKLIWFGFIKTDFNLTEIQLFNPFSLISFFDIETLEPWLVYPIQSVSLLELVYISVLAFGIREAIRQDYDTSLRFTFITYLTGLVVWIIFVTFLTINLIS